MSDEKLTLIEMAIRQRVVQYYKPVESRRLVDVENGIGLMPLPNNSQFQNQRRDYEMRQPQGLYVAGVKIAELRKDAHELLVLPDFSRSETMRSLRNRLLRMVSTYLPGVSIRTERWEVDEVLGDEELIDNNVVVRIRQERDNNVASYAFGETGYIDVQETANAIESMRSDSVSRYRAGDLFVESLAPNPEWVGGGSL